MTEKVAKMSIYLFEWFMQISTVGIQDGSGKIISEDEDKIFDMRGLIPVGNYELIKYLILGTEAKEIWGPTSPRRFRVL